MKLCGGVDSKKLTIVILPLLGPACSYGTAQRLYIETNKAAVPVPKAKTAPSKPLTGHPTRTVIG